MGKNASKRDPPTSELNGRSKFKIELLGHSEWITTEKIEFFKFSPTSKFKETRNLRLS